MPLARDGDLLGDVLGFTPPRGKIVSVCVALTPGAAKLMPICCVDEWPHGTGEQESDGERSHIHEYH